VNCLANGKERWKLGVEDFRLEHIKLFPDLIPKLNLLTGPDPQPNDLVFHTDAPTLILR